MQLLCLRPNLAGDIYRRVPKSDHGNSHVFKRSGCPIIVTVKHLSLELVLTLEIRQPRLAKSPRRDHQSIKLQLLHDFLSISSLPHFPNPQRPPNSSIPVAALTRPPIHWPTRKYFGPKPNMLPQLKMLRILVQIPQLQPMTKIRRVPRRVIREVAKRRRVAERVEYDTIVDGRVHAPRCRVGHRRRVDPLATNVGPLLKALDREAGFEAFFHRYEAGCAYSWSPEVSELASLTLEVDQEIEKTSEGRGNKIPARIYLLRRRLPSSVLGP